jgi:arylsulfatase A-like enzyme
MSEPGRSDAVGEAEGSSPLAALATGAATGLVVAGILGLAEWGAVLWLAPGRELYGAVPWDLVGAALGERVVTHALIWCPLLAGVAFLHRLARRADRATPLPWLVGGVVVGVGVVVLPASLYLAGLRAPRLAWGLRGAALLAAVGLVLWLRGRRLPRRPLVLAACVALLLALVTGALFRASPWFDPAAYRVPPFEGAGPATVAARPHVLLVVLDTVRADRMSLYGWSRATTPYLEELARSAIVFERAIADGTWTIPSHASLFTGRPVRQHGAGLVVPALDGRLPTLAETLSQAGYRTASFSNNSLVSSRTGLDRGFAESRALSGLRAWSRFSWEGVVEALGVPPPLPWLEPDDGAAVTNDLIARWLDAEGTGDAPVFLFVNYLEAHLPWRVPAEFRRRFMTEEQLRRSYALRRSVHGEIVGLMNRRVIEQGSGLISPADAEVLRRQYEASIRYLDHRVEELLGLFAQRGMLDDTLVVITSDHGEYLDSHGMWSHLFGAFNALTHVPLLIREPGRRAPLRVAAPVQLSDVYATVLAAALGRPAAAGPFAARDLVALARAAEGERIAISEVGPLGAAGTLREQRQRARADLARLAVPIVTAQDARFKYVESPLARPRLYDLRRDPLELYDVMRYHPEAADRLAGHLRLWRAAVPTHNPRGPVPVPDSDGAEDLLRELGYLQE